MAEINLADLRKQCITSLYLCTDNVSKYLEEEKEAEFSKLKSYVEGYCMLEAQEEVAIQALERAKRETDDSNIDTLEERFNEHLKKLAGKRLNTNNHPYVKEFKKKVELSYQNAGENLDESDLAITEANNQYLDPITKTPLVDPVKNTVCHHVYERNSIMNMLKTKHSMKCPVAGCGNNTPLSEHNLVSDEELKFRLTLTQHSTIIQERSIMDLDASQ